MNQLTIEELPYQLDSAPLFACLLDMEQPVYLDSARPYSTKGRYDIFSAAPAHRVITEKITSNTNSYNTNLNYFDTLRQALDEHTPAMIGDLVGSEVALLSAVAHASEGHGLVGPGLSGQKTSSGYSQTDRPGNSS